MNLVHNPIVRKSPTILVPLDSFLFLQDKSFYERCGNIIARNRCNGLQGTLNNLAMEDTNSS